MGARPLVTRRTFARLSRGMPALTRLQEELADGSRWDFSDLRALFVNCTLKRSPEPSHTQGLADLAIAIMERNGVTVRGRARRRPRDRDRRVPGHDRARLGARRLARRSSSRSWPPTSSCCSSPIWLGEKSSVCTQVIERLYGNSHLLNDDGQYAYYGRVGGLPHHRQRGRRQALRDEHPLLAPAPRLRDPAAGRRRLDRRGRPGPELPRPRLGRSRERLHEPQHDVHDLEPACTSRGC